MDARRVRLHLFVAGWLGLQLLLPLRGLLLDKRATRGDFSWNMYADHYACSMLYTRVAPDGRVEAIDPAHYFPDTISMMKVFHRDVLPAFHRQLCTGPDPPPRIEALVSCSINGGPWIDLVQPDAAICTAPSYGVRP